MRRRVYDDSDLVGYRELPGHRVAYCDEVELLRYTDFYHSRIDLLRIRLIVIAIAVLILTGAFICMIGRYDHFSMHRKFRNVSETEVCILTDAEDYLGQNYLLIVEEMQAQNFYNIECIPKKDLITGWITRPGTVSRITIAGNPDFKAGEVYRKDTRVLIEYHSR